MYMPVEFKGSPQPTLGLELELQLIDPQTKELVPRSIEVLERCRKLASAQRQRIIHRSEGSLRAVVGSLVKEFESDVVRS